MFLWRNKKNIIFCGGGGGGGGGCKSALFGAMAAAWKTVPFDMPSQWRFMVWSIFTRHSVDSPESKASVAGSEDWSDYVNAQAVMSLHWIHVLKFSFSHCSPHDALLCLLVLRMHHQIVQIHSQGLIGCSCFHIITEWWRWHGLNSTFLCRLCEHLGMSVFALTSVS